MTAAKCFVFGSLAVGSVAISPLEVQAGQIEIDYATKDEKQRFYYLDAEAQNKFVRVGYNDNGDVLYVEDRMDDSQRVAVHWKVSDGREGLCIHNAGSGGILNNTRACNKNFSESEGIQIRGGRCDGSFSSCTRPKDFHDWTPWKSASV